MQRTTNWTTLGKYVLVTAVGILVAIPFVATDNLFIPSDPYHCYIVHQLKNGSCPTGYVPERDPRPGSNCPPRFTEADGRKEYACIDTRSPGVGLYKEQCTDFLRRGEKEDDTCTPRYLIWN
jgi:hypothetical protein